MGQVLPGEQRRSGGMGRAGGGRIAPRSGGLNATITVRFPSEEAADLRELARELDASYSEIVRLAVRKFVQFRIAAGKAERVESEEGQDLSLSNATTITSSASAHV